jgi:signal transduction histidine kinase
LIHNAIEAMDDTTDRARVLKVTSELHRRNAIKVSIEDSGPGISQKRLRQIFDAFVTTKPTGMGLGLAICKMIIDRHGGNNLRTFRWEQWYHSANHSSDF